MGGKKKKTEHNAGILSGKQKQRQLTAPRRSKSTVLQRCTAHFVEGGGEGARSSPEAVHPALDVDSHRMDQPGQVKGSRPGSPERICTEKLHSLSGPGETASKVQGHPTAGLRGGAATEPQSSSAFASNHILSDAPCDGRRHPVWPSLHRTMQVWAVGLDRTTASGLQVCMTTGAHPMPQPCGSALRTCICHSRAATHII